MSCADVRARLDGYVDGSLAVRDRTAVEAHLAECASCRAEVDDLHRLIEAASSLPRSITPPDEAWAAVSRAIEKTPRSSRHAWRTRRAWLAAAAVLVMLSSGATVVWLHHGQSSGAAAAALQPTSYRATERRYADAVADLERTFAARRAQLSPATVAVVERSLRSIDQAIDEARRALAADSASTGLGDLLSSAYRAKIDLLQRATRL